MRSKACSFGDVGSHECSYPGMVATIGMIVPDLFGRFGGDLSPSMGLQLGSNEQTNPFRESGPSKEVLGHPLHHRGGQVSVPVDRALCWGVSVKRRLQEVVSETFIDHLWLRSNMLDLGPQQWLRVSARPSTRCLQRAGCRSLLLQGRSRLDGLERALKAF